MAEETTREPVDAAAFGAALRSAIPNLYVNGFMNSTSASDVVTVLVTNGRPTAILNLSFSSAKTYATAILSLIENIEKATGQKILTADDIAKAMGDAGVAEVDVGVSQ